MYSDYIVTKNPDEKYRKEVISRIKANNGYCPSRFERTPNTKCHCKDFKENGDCICGLFIKIPCRDVTEEE